MGGNVKLCGFPEETAGDQMSLRDLVFKIIKIMVPEVVWVQEDLERLCGL